MARSIATPRGPGARLSFALAVVITIALGLASRRWAAALPDFVGAYVGDGLWAAMVYFGLGALAPGALWTRRAALALALCFAIEFSQLYHAPWIDQVRATRVGALVLGFGFLWTDLVAYTLGVGVAAGLAHALHRKRTSAGTRLDDRSPS
jgi:Protein of unknown function (DUF2809)